jgi:hypothetical protein
MGTISDVVKLTRSARAHLDRVLEPASNWPERKGHLDMAVELLKAAGASAMKTMLASEEAAGIVLPGQTSLDDAIEGAEDEQRRSAATHRVDGNGVVQTPTDSADPRTNHTHILPVATLDEGGSYLPCRACGISPADDAFDGPGVIVEASEDPRWVVVAIGEHRVQLVRQDSVGETEENFAARVAAFTQQDPCAADGHDMPELPDPEDGEQNECARCGLTVEFRAGTWAPLERTVGELEADESERQRTTNATARNGQLDAHMNMALAALRNCAASTPDKPERSTVEVAGIAGLSTAEARKALAALAEGGAEVERVRRGVWAFGGVIELEGAAVGPNREAVGAS